MKEKFHCVTFRVCATDKTENLYVCKKLKEN